MKSIELILDSVGAGVNKRKDIDNTLLRKTKIKMVAYKGGFDGICKNWEISDARKYGLCPSRFDVHHIIPVCCKNSTPQIDNLIVIEKKAHIWLHNNIYNPALAKCDAGQSCFIWFPDIDVTKAILWEDIEPFASAFEQERRRMFLSMNER